MAMIQDPDLLNIGTEITINTGARTFTLVEAGNLVAKDGVDMNALWSFFVDKWATATYKPYPFPMNKVDNRSGQYIFGRDPGGTGGHCRSKDTGADDRPGAAAGQ